MISNAKKKLIHVAKREIGLSDSDYREIMRRHTGMTSCADPNFSDFHFKEIIDHFKIAHGFEVKRKFQQRVARDPDALPSPQHLRMLEHVIEDFSQHEPAARRRDFQRGFNERVIKRPWPQTRREVNKMIEAWGARLRRAEARAREKIKAEGKRMKAEGSEASSFIPHPSSFESLPEECPF